MASQPVSMMSATWSSPAGRAQRLTQEAAPAVEIDFHGAPILPLALFLQQLVVVRALAQQLGATPGAASVNAGGDAIT